MLLYGIFHNFALFKEQSSFNLTKGMSCQELLEIFRKNCDRNKSIKRLKARIHKEFLFSPPDCSAIMGTFGPMGVPNFSTKQLTTNAISCRVSYYCPLRTIGEISFFTHLNRDKIKKPT